MRMMRWPIPVWTSPGQPLPWTIISLAQVSIWLRQMGEEHWEQLAEALPERLEGLVTAFGQQAHARYPDVLVRREPQGGLTLAQGTQQLSLLVGEPARTPHGWAGAELRLVRPKFRPVPPVVLLLTFARGWHPEWLAAHSQLLGAHFVVVDDVFVSHTLDAVFAPITP